MDNRRRMMWKKPPEYAIYYTSTDGNIVTPHSRATWGGAKIVSNTYENCEGKIVFDKKVTSIYKSFQNCNTLKTITIPDSVTLIDYYAFSDCTSLASVTIPNSVRSIGTYAFSNCTSLTSITIPDSVTSIRQGAFYKCNNLIRVDTSSIYNWCRISFAQYAGYLFYYNAQLYINGKIIDDVIIPSDVSKIHNYAFYKQPITSITIPESVTSIGEYAFGDCTSLTSVIIPDSVTDIGIWAFRNCTSLKSITIPESVTSIGSSAFENCSALESVDITDLSAWCKISFGNSTANPLYNGVKLYLNGSELTDIAIPSDITEIKNDTFYGCTSLTSVNIPDSVTSIGDNAFYYCISLPSVTIGNGVTKIGGAAFSSCSSLTSVTIGNNVTEIGNNAFYRCITLKNIYSLNTIAPTIKNDSFTSVASNGVLIHPTNSDYSSWMQTSPYYLGYYNWTSQGAYTPQTYYDLSITAHDVKGNSTTTTISWTCMSDGIDTITGEPITGIQLSGIATSEEFPQNTSETETVERTITFEYQGLTASTTITQGVWINQSYELVLNDNWQLSTAVANPDSALYDGVYESFSNYNKNSTAAIMYIDISGYETFKLYIRSYAESNYDYVMVSQLDQTIDNNSSYSNTTLVKAHTRGTQKSGTTISDYKLVEFTGLDGGEHRITVVYRKDGSGNSGTDKGYLIIPRQ